LVVVDINRGSLIRPKDVPRRGLNKDRKVDGVDFTIWLTIYGKDTGNGANERDFNEGGKV